MAGSVNDFVSASISINDATPLASSFGTLLHLVHTTSWVGMQTFTNDNDGLAALVALGVTTDHPAYAALLAASKQNPKIDTVKMWARPAPHAEIVQVAPAVQGTGYKHKVEFSVDGLNYLTATYTEAPGDTVNLIVTGLVAAANALALSMTLNAGAGTSFTVTHTSSAKKAYLRNPSTSLTLTNTSTDTALATDYSAALAADPAFYGVTCDSNLESAGNALQSVVEASLRYLMFTSLDTGVAGVSTTDVGSDFKAAGANRATVIYSTDTGTYPAVAALATGLSFVPGSYTFHAKNWIGVTPENVTATQITNLRSKNVMFMALVNGLRLSYDGKAGGGRFMDLTLGSDYLSSNLKNSALIVIANNAKIPYNDAGGALFEAAARGACDRSVETLFLEAGYTVTVPKIPSGATPTEIATRTFPKIKIIGRLTGAVHKAQYEATLSVS